MPPRHIQLENASNLRDLGGWPTLDGRTVRTGLVYRAPALANLSEADARVIASLGLRTVCDLRGARERMHVPVEIPGATSLSLAIEPSVGGELRDIMRTGEITGHATAEDFFGLLLNAYQAYALQSLPQYRGVFAQILREDGLPLLLHCTAGKDRTGFGAALLLSALGVAWDDVLADYLATNDQWRRESASSLVLPPPLAELLLRAHAELLEAAFDAIRNVYGSLDAYLSKAIGLDADARARLADRLLQA
jgi:protein-tyrosine phosphatase